MWFVKVSIGADNKLRSLESGEVVLFCCSVGVEVMVPGVQHTTGANSTNSGYG